MTLASTPASLDPSSCSCLGWRTIPVGSLMLVFPARLRRRLRAPIALAAVTAALAVHLGAPWLVSGPTAAAAADATESRTLAGPKGTGWKLEVTPGDLSQVKAGDTVTLAFSGLKPNERVLAGMCPLGLGPKLDPFYLPYLGMPCNATLSTGLPGGTDATDKTSPAYSTVYDDGQPAYARTDGTLSLDFRVGRGLTLSGITYQGENSTLVQNVEYSCDEDNPCNIAFSVGRLSDEGFTSYDWNDFASLEVAPKSLTADTTGCTGLGPQTITASGSERLQGLLSTLNRNTCSATPGPLPVSYVANGEQSNLSKVGNGADLAFAGSSLIARQPVPGTLAIPIAVNGVTLSQFGGKPAASNTEGKVAATPDPIPALALQPADAAAIILHRFVSDALPTEDVSQAAALNPLAAALRSRPENAKALSTFDPSFFGLPLNAAPTVTYGVGPDSTAIALSAYLAAKAPEAWAFPKNAVNDSLQRSEKPVGKVTSFDGIKDGGLGESGPLLTSQVSSVGGLYTALFHKDVFSEIAKVCPDRGFADGGALQAPLAGGCLRYAVMDAATAGALKLTSSKLSTGTSYVEPTLDGLATAAATGTLNADGYFESSDPGAYPLSFIEYAIVPKAPLVDDSCKPRTAAQDQLKKFLTYVLGDGQAIIGDGLAPLPANVKEQATAALAQLGTGPGTGKCAPKAIVKKTDTTSSGNDGSGGGIDSGGAGSGGGTGGNGSGSDNGGSGTGSNGTGDNGSDDSAGPVASKDLSKKSQAAAGFVPSFAGSAASSSTLALLGLLLLAALASLTALLGADGPSGLLDRIRGRS